MRYEAVFIDADDTLLDFELAEQKALQLLIQHMNLPDDAKEDYRRVNKECWKAFENAVLNRDKKQFELYHKFVLSREQDLINSKQNHLEEELLN